MFNITGSLGIDNLNQILETIGHLLTTATREVVASCLSFVKVYITSMPAPVIATSLGVIVSHLQMKFYQLFYKTIPCFNSAQVKSITSMTEDCKRHFRLKVRDILDRLVRKYGCDSITPHVHESDKVMHRRLRNLRKLNARKKKQKEVQKKEEEEQSDDEEFAVRAKPRRYTNHSLNIEFSNEMLAVT